MRVIVSALDDLGLLPVSAEEALAPDNKTYTRWTLHSTSHMLGLDVHDCAAASAETYKHGPLKEGMVLTVGRPLLPGGRPVVPEELRGIGIRIEDDIAVTADGSVNLSAALPREPVRSRSGWPACGLSPRPAPPPPSGGSRRAGLRVALRRLLLEHLDDLLHRETLRLRQNFAMKPIASSDSIDRMTITQGSPMACCMAGNAEISAKLAIQLTRRPWPRRGRVRRSGTHLALQQPAGAADAHRERRDEDREADHHDDDLRGTGQPGDPGRDQHEHRHAA